MKVSLCEKLVDFRSTFINMAIPIVQASEPGLPMKTKLREGIEVDLWTRWDIDGTKDMTLKDLMEYVHKTYELKVHDVMKAG